jgi:hypothetical protein
MKSHAIIITSMGRVEHLKVCLPTVIEHTKDAPIYIVDMECPDRSGEWAQRTYPERVRAVFTKARHVGEEKFFHKTRALNQGANQAEIDGAKVLVFLDADTRVQQGFWGAVQHPGKRFIIASSRTPRLCGFIALETRTFRRNGAFNERILHYGAEDLELRVRLFFNNVDYTELRPGLLLSLQHPDELRTRHLEEKDTLLSGKNNLEFIAKQFPKMAQHANDQRFKRLLAG